MIIKNSYKRSRMGIDQESLSKCQRHVYVSKSKKIINFNFFILKVYSARSRHLSIQAKLRKALKKVTCKLQKSTQDARFNVTQPRTCSRQLSLYQSLFIASAQLFCLVEVRIQILMETLLEFIPNQRPHENSNL